MHSSERFSKAAFLTGELGLTSGLGEAFFAFFVFMPRPHNCTGGHQATENLTRRDLL
jgi:hypothetical protein